MKILLTHRLCMIGGIEAWMLSLQRAYRALGHECELFFFEHGPMARYLPNDGKTHFGELDDCLRLVKTCGFNIVHSPTMDWQTGVSAVRGTGAKLIVTAHGLLPHQFDSATCDALTSVSRWLADEMQPRTDLPVQVIHNGVELDRFFGSAQQPPTAASPIVAWVGRGRDLVPKHLDRFAAIAPALRRVGLRLWLAEPSGFAGLAQVMPEAAQTLCEQVESWRSVAPHEMPDFYRQVAASGGCVLSTSRYEGFGLALAEAQACGCPVIAPDVPGLNEVVTAAAGGVLYAFDTAPEALAAVVIETLRDAKRMVWRRHAVAQHARERFGFSQMVERYLQVYQQAPYAPRSVKRAGTFSLRNVRQRWREYLAQRWSPGERQYETSLRLAARQEWQLAAVAARTALATCPTLFVRPRRLAHLLKTQLHTGAI